MCLNSLQFYPLEKTQHSETSGEMKFGELVLSVGYSSVVEVTVIQGENLGMLTSFTTLSDHDKYYYALP